MPKYIVEGTIAFTHTVTLARTFKRTIARRIVEAESEQAARDAVVEDEMDIEIENASRSLYDEVDAYVDEHKPGTVIGVTDIDANPELAEYYARLELEQTMRRLGPTIAPPLLEELSP